MPVTAETARTTEIPSASTSAIPRSSARGRGRPLFGAPPSGYCVLDVAASEPQVLDSPKLPPRESGRALSFVTLERGNGCARRRRPGCQECPQPAVDGLGARCSVAAKAKRAELEEVAYDVERFLAERLHFVFQEPEAVGGRVDDIAQPHAAVEGGHHLLHIRRRVNRVLRAFSELDTPVDVDGTPSRRLELATQSQARGEADACLRKPFAATELGELRSRFEGAQDLIAGVVELVLVQLVHSRGVSAGRPLVEDGRALADELHHGAGEVPGPPGPRFAERLAGEVRVPLRGVCERIRGQRGEDPALAAARFGPLEDALVRIALVEREPAHEHRSVAAIVQMLGRSEDHPLRHFVLGELTVSVRPATLWGDDVGRIARDQVERFAFHWI